MAFTYQDENINASGLPRRAGNYYNSRKRGGYKAHSHLSKDQVVQSSLKFIVKRDKEYLLNFYDPNEIVEWKDVV